MALIRSIERQGLDRDSRHTEVVCTYTIVRDDSGVCLQIDTYGSADRQDKGKKSQSTRFNPEAIEQLKAIVANL